VFAVIVAVVAVVSVTEVVFLAVTVVVVVVAASMFVGVAGTVVVVVSVTVVVVVASCTAIVIFGGGINHKAAGQLADWGAIRIFKHDVGERQSVDKNRFGEAITKHNRWLFCRNLGTKRDQGWVCTVSRVHCDCQRSSRQHGINDIPTQVRDHGGIRSTIQERVGIVLAGRCQRLDCISFSV
jgi:hypothetical protein